MTQNTLIAATRKILAQTFAIYVKTHAFHWNVTGEDFAKLHALFEEQYTDLWTAVDELAEHLRIRGEIAPTNVGDIMKGATLKDAASTTDADTMLKVLADDHRTVEADLLEAIEAAEGGKDPALGDYFTQRLSIHQKARWMLESSFNNA